MKFRLCQIKSERTARGKPSRWGTEKKQLAMRRLRQQLIKQMKNNKAPEPSGMTSEMFRALEQDGTEWIYKHNSKWVHGTGKTTTSVKGERNTDIIQVCRLTRDLDFISARIVNWDLSKAIFRFGIKEGGAVEQRGRIGQHFPSKWTY